MLLSHLVLFGFIYPGERALIPSAVMKDLVSRLLAELEVPTRDSKVCQGTLLSRAQYLVDVDEWGYEDARAAAARQHDRRADRGLDRGDRQIPSGQGAGIRDRVRRSGLRDPAAAHSVDPITIPTDSVRQSYRPPLAHRERLRADRATSVREQTSARSCTRRGQVLELDRVNALVARAGRA